MVKNLTKWSNQLPKKDYKAVKEEHTSFPFCRIIIHPSCRTTLTRSEVLDMIMMFTAFNNLKSLTLLQKSPSSNMEVTWLLFQLTPSSWTRQSTTISSVQMFAAQKQTKQIPLGQAWPGQPGSSFALWVDCTLLTISLTCHLESHTVQAAFTDIVTKQWKWCFVEFVDVQWKWNDENWNRHTSAVQGVALRTGYHDPLWQSIFWTLLNTLPCSQKRMIFCVKNVF